MKKIIPAVLSVILLITVVFSAAACTPNEIQVDKLVVYNWADYIYDSKLTDFKEYYKSLTGNDIDITYVTFDTNETMLTKIMQGDARVDVICPSEYAIQKLIESDMLVALNYFDENEYAKGLNVNSDLYEHNSSNVDNDIINKINEAFGEIRVEGKDDLQNMTDYIVPYMYGTLGILYNKYSFMEMNIYDYEIINQANWGILFNDDGEGNLLSDELTGSILMKDSIRDSYAATVFYLLESGKLDGKLADDGRAYADMPAGELINAVDDTLIELCKKALIEQKKQLFGYEVDFGKDDLLKGNATVDLAWSGDAMYAVEESWDDALCKPCSEERHTRVYGEEKRDENDEKYYLCKYCKEKCGDYELGYYVPHTTGNIWFDGWVIPKNHEPSHLNAIKLFINFLNNPEVAAQNMLEIGYSSAVSPDAVRSNDGARTALAEAYVVNDDSWERLDEDGNPITKFDYDSWEEFEEYFFDYRDEMDNSNWRYPFVIAETSDGYDRGLNTLGVMRDYGVNNKAVVTMWNSARSTGDNALPLLGWTALAVVVTAGIIALSQFIKFRIKSVVKLPDDANQSSI